MAAAKAIVCGSSIEYTNATGSDIASKAVVVIGSLVGIAAGIIKDTETGIVLLEGVWEVDKTTSLAIAQGDKLHWNTSTKKVTKTVTDKPIGTAYKAAASAGTRVEVKLYENAVNGAVAANVAAIATANGSDASTTQALANATKTSVNAILTALKAAGIMVADA
jgi:predicted RecA/RadA family phage recombinase